MARAPDSCRFAIDSGDQAAATSGPATASTPPTRPARASPSSASCTPPWTALESATKVLARLLALNAARAGAEAGHSVPGRSRPVDAGDILGRSI